MCGGRNGIGALVDGGERDGGGAGVLGVVCAMPIPPCIWRLLWTLKIVDVLDVDHVGRDLLPPEEDGMGEAD